MIIKISILELRYSSFCCYLLMPIYVDRQADSILQGIAGGSVQTHRIRQNVARFVLARQHVDQNVECFGFSLNYHF